VLNLATNKSNFNLNKIIMSELIRPPLDCIEHPFVLGNKGKLGSELSRTLAAIRNTEADCADIKTSEEILIAADADLILSAITAANQTTQLPKMLASYLASAPEKTRFIVNLNSVQASVRDAVVQELDNPEIVSPTKPTVLISLHQMHPPQDFRDLDEKIWVLTDITVLGVTDETDKEILENQATQAVQGILATLPQCYGNNPEAQATLVDLRDGYKSEGMDLSGPEFHDYIAAYYQALFHMVRLLPGVDDSEWYQANFSHVGATHDLSEKIANAEPFAKPLNRKFLEMLGDKTDVPSLLAAVSSILQEAQTLLANVENAGALKTRNVRILEDLINS